MTGSSLLPLPPEAVKETARMSADHTPKRSSPSSQPPFWSTIGPAIPSWPGGDPRKQRASQEGWDLVMGSGTLRFKLPAACFSGFLSQTSWPQVTIYQRPEFLEEHGVGATLRRALHIYKDRMTRGHRLRTTKLRAQGETRSSLTLYQRKSRGAEGQGARRLGQGHNSKSPAGEHKSPGLLTLHQLLTKKWVQAGVTIIRQIRSRRTRSTCSPGQRGSRPRTWPCFSHTQGDHGEVGD